MNKFATLTFLAASLALSGMAATVTVTCTAFPTNLGATNGATSTVSCGGFNSAAAANGINLATVIDISSVELSVFENFNGGNGTVTAGTITMTAPLLGGVTWASPTISSTGNGTFTGAGPTSTDDTTNGVYAVGGPFAADYSVDLQSTYTGFLSNNSGYVTAMYTYDSTAPEPASMMLLGSGLVAVGFLRRRAVR